METYTVQEAKDELKSSIAVYLQKDEDGNYRMKEVNRLPFYLEGPPGVGKTEMAGQIAKELGIGFVNLSITHHTRNTVLGLPLIREISDEDRTKYTEYTMSEIIAMVEKKYAKGYTEGILLVDEFASMSETLVPVILAFLQTKNIGGHVLPEGWILVLCANPPEYNRTARRFDVAVMDRVRLLQIEPSAAEFVRYGEKQGFHKDILQYLRQYPDDFCRCAAGSSKDEGEVVTARSWENLSWCLQGYERDGTGVTAGLIRQFIKSDDASLRFFRYYLSCRSGVSPEQMEEILDGKNLLRHVDTARQKDYGMRFQMMCFLANTLTRSCEECQKRMDDTFYLPFAAKAMVEEDRKTDIGLRTLIRQRMNGVFQAHNAPFHPLDEQEKKDWQEMESRFNPIDLLMNAAARAAGEDREDESAEFLKMVDAYCEEVRDALKPQMEKISERVGNVCSFLEQIEGKDNLLDVFIRMLNASKGMLDVMRETRNPLYLKYNKRAYGTDTFLKRTSQQLPDEEALA